jgi:hypothetical protein
LAHTAPRGIFWFFGYAVHHITRACSVFFIGMAWIRRARSRQDGALYSRKRNNEVMAASRALRVRGELLRFFSRLDLLGILGIAPC